MGNLVVFITAPNEDEASKIARALVEGRLAGCVNIINDIRSIYSWQGKTEDESEVLMIVKTQSNLFDNLSRKVRSFTATQCQRLLRCLSLKDLEIT